MYTYTVIAAFILLSAQAASEGQLLSTSRPSLHLHFSCEGSTRTQGVVGLFLRALQTFSSQELAATLCLSAEPGPGMPQESSCIPTNENSVEVNYRAEAEAARRSIDNCEENFGGFQCSRIANCEGSQRPGLYLESTRLRDDVVWLEMLSQLCFSSNFSSSHCASFCGPNCLYSMLNPNHCEAACDVPSCHSSFSACSRYLEVNESCALGCIPAMISNQQCDAECNVVSCLYDGEDCGCPASCTTDMRSNKECDKPCNITACQFDGKICLDGNGGADEGDPSWVKWVIGSLSIVCFFLLTIIGYLIFVHLRGQRQSNHLRELNAENAHGRNVSDFSVDEHGVFIRVPNSIAAATMNLDITENDTPYTFRTFQLNQDTIERFFPELKYEPGLSEFEEKMCTVCLGEPKIGELVRKTLCRHVFHKNCLDEWLLGRAARPKCPACAQNPFVPDQVSQTLMCNGASAAQSFVGREDLADHSQPEALTPQ